MKSNWHLLVFAWLMAAAATASALFIGEVMGMAPCVLCWYQRIAMYPLVLIAGTGIVMRDPHWKAYALPLALAGLAVSIYHNLLYYGLIPESIAPCKPSPGSLSRKASEPSALSSGGNTSGFMKTSTLPRATLAPKLLPFMPHLMD